MSALVGFGHSKTPVTDTDTDRFGVPALGVAPRLVTSGFGVGFDQAASRGGAMISPLSVAPSLAHQAEPRVGRHACGDDPSPAVLADILSRPAAANANGRPKAAILMSPGDRKGQNR
jgi:hypothetical protein